MTLAPATILGNFEIAARIGAGGMGEVYRAHDKKLGRDVAIKVLATKRERDARATARFEREARLLAALNHPNVATIYGFEVSSDGSQEISYLVMELIDGETLDELIRKRAFETSDAVPVLLQIAGGLEAAHDRGIVHRDLKPPNIKITSDGLVKILDFGIAKRQETDVTLAATRDVQTEEGAVAGTLSYMSPEQIRGDQVDKRSDIWAFGCVAYEMVTGRLAFGGESPSERVGAILGRTPDTTLLPEDFSRPLRQLLDRCLEKDPRRRLRDIGEARIQIEAVAQREALRTSSDIGLFDDVPGWQPQTGEAIPGRPNWRLVERLGEGGFGDVWLAEHARSEAQRVFKFCVDEERLRGLKREIVLLRLLRRSLGERPDIAQVYDWQLDLEPRFLETQYTDGGDLARWCEAQGGVEEVALEQRLELVAQVAVALAAAHGAGVLHKDVKPSNVLIGGNAEHPQALLADFGIGLVAEAEAVSAGLTVMGLGDSLLSDESPGLGTHLYIAPELLEGKEATIRSDIFSLGVVLYQMVVGDLRRALATGWQEHVEDPLLREDIARCVDGTVERRLGDAGELAVRLRELDERRSQILEEERLERERTQRERRAEEERLRALERRRQVRWAAVLGLLALLVVSGLAFRERQRADDERALRREAEYARYLSDLQLAAAQIEAGSLSQARSLLERTPEADRNWEFGHLAHRARLGERSSVHEIPPKPGRTAAEQWRGAVPGVVATLRGDEQNRGVEFALSPDGESLVSAATHPHAVLWDFVEGVELATYSAPTDVTSAAFSRDGRFLAVLSAAQVSIWDLDEGTEISRLEGRGLDFFGAWFSNDAKTLLTSHHRDVVKLWDVPSGQLKAERSQFGLGSNDINIGVHFPASGRSVLIPGGASGVIELDLEDASVLSSQPLDIGQNRRVRSVTPDGRWALADSSVDESLWVIELVTGSVVLESATSRISFSADGKLWSRLGLDGTLQLLDGPVGEVLLTAPELLPAVVNKVELSDDGLRIGYFDPGDNSVRVLAPGSASVRADMLKVHDGRIVDAIYNADGSMLVTAAHDHTATVWDTSPLRQRLRLEGHTGPLQAIQLSPDETRVKTTSWDGTDAVWDARSGARLFTLENGIDERGDSAAGSIATVTVQDSPPFSPDSRRVALARPGGKATVVDATSGEVLAELDASGAWKWQVGWSPRGDIVFTTGIYQKPIEIWDPESGQRLRVLEAVDVPWRVELSPDGSRIAAGQSGGHLQVWDVASGEEILHVQGDDQNVGSVHWSGDGALLIAASINQQARLWNAQSGELVARFCCQNERALDALLSPDQTRVLTISYFGELRLWDLQGNALLSLEPADRFSDTAWSPDGRTIVAALNDGRLQFWETNSWSQATQ